jgi:hypothetical protein
MRIPLSTKKGRFYVATSMTDAFSSWDTLENALASYGRLPPDEQTKVIGVIDVRGVHTSKHKVSKPPGPS